MNPVPLRAARVRIPDRPRPPLRTRSVPLALALLLVLATAPPPARAATTLGGDDRLAAVSTIATPRDVCGMEIDEEGRIYVMVGVEDTLEGIQRCARIEVSRSSDGGTTWFPWATLVDPDPLARIEEARMVIAQGSVDRLYIVFTSAREGVFSTKVKLAYADLASPAGFTYRQVASEADNGFSRPRIATDAEVVGAFHLFVVFAAGEGLKFARSSDFGETWDVPYVVAPRPSIASSWYMVDPEITYGRTGVVHLAWMASKTGATDSTCVRYRRALSYAAGAANWQPIVDLSPSQNWFRYSSPAIAASHAENKVIVAYEAEHYYAPLTMWIHNQGVVHASFDAGASWGAADTALIASSVREMRALFSPAPAFYLSGRVGGVPGVLRAYPTDLLDWSDFMAMGDRVYPFVETGSQGALLDYDATRSNAVALAWWEADGTNSTADSTMFDAAWREWMGQPVLEAGYPLALASPPVSPPALADVNEDGHLEIVFSDNAGNVQVLDHAGATLPGWPVDVGTVPRGAAVAVADVDLDGDMEIAAGTSAGVVHLLRASGAEEAGWPVTLAGSGNVFVSIGGVSPGGGRQVVACNGTQVHCLNASGAELSGWPRAAGGTLKGPAAIGDIDDDGDREVVFVSGARVQAEPGGAGGTQMSRTFTGQTFTYPPTLADVDLDGALEIAVPSDSGHVYLVDHHGLDLPGWPVGSMYDRNATAVSFADMLGGDGAPEIVFGQKDSLISVYSAAGTLAPWWPHRTGAAFFYAQPILENIDGTAVASVVTASGDGYAYAWDITGAGCREGWPRELWDGCLWSAAAGDIDADGQPEFVFPSNPMSVFHVKAPDMPHDAVERWPMYAFDAARTGCLACGSDEPLADVPGAAAPATLRFAPPAPNPTRGAVRLAFELPRPATVRLVLVDVAGRVVRTLLKEECAAGARAVTWDGAGRHGEPVAAGIYFARLEVGDERGSRALTRRLARIE